MQNGRLVAGLRPIVRRNNKSYSSRTSGHAVIVKDMNLNSVFGGK